MPYSLSVSGFEIEIGLVRISDLNLHEEIIPSLLRELSESIRSEDQLRHPVIVDKETLTVLDGMHRVAALKELDCEYAPVCLVNYQDSKVRAGSWSRLWKNLTPKELLKSCTKASFSTEPCGGEDVEKILNGKIVKAAIVSKGECHLLDKDANGVKGIYGAVKEVEHELEGRGVEVEYGVGKSILQKIQTGGVALLLPPASKKKIIEIACSSSVFPHKTTRHIVPARPMGINASLDLLSGEKGLEEADSILTKSLEEREIESIPPGSSFEGREYEEELRVFK